MAKTDTSGSAQGRFTVSIPAELGSQLDAIGTRISKAVAEQTGVTIELTRAQVVTSLVKSALNHQAPAEAHS